MFEDIDQKLLYEKIKKHGYFTGSRAICTNDIEFDDKDVDYDFLLISGQLCDNFTAAQRNWMYYNQNSNQRSKEESWKFYLFVDGKDITIDLLLVEEKEYHVWCVATKICKHVNNCVIKGILNNKTNRVTFFESMKYALREMKGFEI